MARARARSLSPIGLSDSYVAVAVGLHVVVLERTSGALRWNSDTVTSSVHCAGPVCLAIYAEHIHAVDADDGAAFWERRLLADVALIVHDEHRLFIVTEDGGATCLDAASGSIRWSYNGTYRNPLMVYGDLEDDDLDANDDLEDDSAVVADLVEWSSALVGDVFQWRSPDGVSRAVDAATGVDAVGSDDVDLLSSGWVDAWLDAEQSEWWHQRSFTGGAVRLLTSGAGWDADHRGALVIGGENDEILHHLEPGWQYDRAAVASDSGAVAMLAERQRDYADEDDDDQEVEDPDDGHQWLLSIRLDEEAGIVVEHGGRGHSGATYEDLSVENVPRDLGEHVPACASCADVPASDPTLTVWLFEGDTT